MMSSGTSKALRTPVLPLLFSMVLLAQASGPAAADSLGQVPGQAADLQPQLQAARECLKSGEYERAIDLLRAAIDRARNRLPELREAYLLLIKTYVLRGNEYKLEIQGRPTSELYYQQARQTIAECLGTKELRHTEPLPAAEYPPEMADLFAAVRNEIFGGLRIVTLDPREAVVLLDADTLRVAPGDSLPAEKDISVGSHLIVVRSSGYNGRTEEIRISPGSVLELRYPLEKKHGKGWFALRGGVAGSVVAGTLWAVLGRGKTESSGPGELPGPPNPPQ